MSDTEKANYEESGDQPHVGTDPMQLPQQDVERKKEVAPDPEKVEEAEREKERE